MSPSTGGLLALTQYNRRRHALWLVLGLLGAGCVYDSDDPCGPNQVRWEDSSLCACAEGTAYSPTGCQPCGEHELATPSGCLCEPGYARTQPTNPCQEVPADIGTPCTSSLECLSPSFPHCQTSPHGGYCTSLGCTGDADCSGGYACNLQGAPPFCQRPPLGAGRGCASDADCADNSEALFCDTLFSFTCLVRDCTVEPNNCFPGSECCAFGPIPLCIPVGACFQP